MQVSCSYGQQLSAVNSVGSQGGTPGKDISPLCDITKGCLTRNACFSSLLGLVRALFFSLSLVSSLKG